MADAYKDGPTPWRDEETLQRLYHGEGMTTYEIGERLGCDGTTVRRWMKRHDIDRRYSNDRPFTDRFWEKVDKGGQDECWEWQAVMSGGYGNISIDGDHSRAHRVAYMLERGDPGDLQVNHHCDNRACVNPDHLYLGTQHENMQDMIERGRARWAEGSDCHNAKLTEEDVRDIRERAQEGESQYDIAAEYDICQTTVSGIVSGERWSHV